jgi:hypothetical protein
MHLPDEHMAAPIWPDAWTPVATYARAAPINWPERILFVAGEVLEESGTLRVHIVLDVERGCQWAEAEFPPEEWSRITEALVEEFSSMRAVQEAARKDAIAKAREAIAKLDRRAL